MTPNLVTPFSSPYGDLPSPLRGLSVYLVLGSPTTLGPYPPGNSSLTPT